MPPWTPPVAPSAHIVSPPWRKDVKAVARPSYSAEELARANAFLADMRKSLASSIYADNVKVHEILLALAIAGGFGLSKDGASTFVPMVPFRTPPRGCPEGYDTVVRRGVSSCIHQPEASYQAGLDRFLALVDPLDVVAYSGDLPQFFNELFKNSDYSFLSIEERVRLVVAVLGALDMVTSQLGQPLLWDTTSKSLQAWIAHIVGGAAEPPQDTSNDVGLATLPSDQVDRLKAAGKATVKQLPPAWAQEIVAPGGEAAGKALNLLVGGVLGLGLAMSNFGLVKTPEGADKNEIRETNNWLKLGKLDAKAADCDASSLFDIDSSRCVVTFPTVEAGVDYTYKSLSDPKAIKVHDALVSGDIGLLAAAFLDAGYLYPVATTQEAWLSFKDRLKTAFAAMTKAIGQDPGWKDTDYKPNFPSLSTVGGDGKDPGKDSTTNDKKEEGLSTGAKVAIGVGVVGLVGAVVWALSSSPPAPSAPVPAGGGALPTTTPPQLPAGSAPSGSYLANPADPSSVEAWRKFAFQTNDVQWLWYLAQQGTPELRVSVVMNPNTPFSILEFLVRDANSEVRAEAAQRVAEVTDNPEWLRWLAKAKFDPTVNIFIKKAVAANRATPPDAMMSLVSDPKSAGSTALAILVARPDLPYNVMWTISRGSDHVLRRELASNPNTPPDLLDWLTKDSNYFVQVAAIRNPQTPIASVQAQLGAENALVQDAARERLGVKGKKVKRQGVPLPAPPEPAEAPVRTLTNKSAEHARLVGIFQEAWNAAIKAADRVSDGGSSNFDQAYLFGKSANKAHLTAAQEVGFRPDKRTHGRAFLYSPRPGQGGKRTAQAKAISDVLNAHGIEASVYYAMD